MEENVFTNKGLYSYHFDKNKRERRISDFNKIYNILKDHLNPTQIARINNVKIQEYVDLYQEENKEFISKVLNAVMHIPFSKFLNDTKEQTEIFNKTINKKKYIYIIGVRTDVGSSSTDYNLYKSNFWMFMLLYQFLDTKPYDILLDLKIAINLYGDEHDYLIVDDCIYSGSQIVENVLYTNSSETLYKYPDSFITESETKKTLYKPVQQHNIKIHLLVPYISNIGYRKISNLRLVTSLDITCYNKYIVNSYSNILDSQTLHKLKTLYNNFIKINTDNLIPIFFDHKIADIISTIDLILIKGQVLDNKDLRLVFIDACAYDESNPYYREFDPKKNDFFYKKLYCPNPPYLDFEKILKKELK
jgi:hypothetical protein